MNLFINILKRDIKLSLGKSGGVTSVLMFFVIAVCLFPFGVGADNLILNKISAGVIWVCALLSSMLSIPYLFEEDFEDGTLAQLLLQGYSAQIIVIAKVFSQIIINIVPLVVVSPLLAILVNMDESKIVNLALTIVVGVPILILIGSVGAALILTIKRAAGLVSILVLPLYIPVLIFAVSAVTADDANFTSSISLMLGLLLFTLPVSIAASSMAIKIAVEENG